MDGDKYLGKYRVKTERVKWHDYNNGTYFVTICTHNREHYFGEIVGGELIMTDIGQYTNGVFCSLSKYYPYAQIHSYVIMPDHLHAILTIDGKLTNRVSKDTVDNKGGITGEENPMIKQCLGTIIRGLKARVTHYANANNIPFAWQPLFYEHIIHDDKALSQIEDYIKSNVSRWEETR